MPLPIYDPKRACCKCGSTDVSTTYRTTSQISVSVNGSCGTDAPHLCRFCRVCGYRWAEAPLDGATRPWIAPKGEGTTP